MITTTSQGFSAPRDPLVIACEIANRTVPRSGWREIRRAKREAWMILNDREDAVARSFVNAAAIPCSKGSLVERIRSRRLAALTRALQSDSRATRIIHLGNYKHLRSMGEAKLRGA